MKVMRNYYEVLGVSRLAGEEEIKSAFRKAAKNYHPDRNPGDAWAEARFKEVNEAHDILKDAQKRGAYDRSLRRRARGGHSGRIAAAGGLAFLLGVFCGASAVFYWILFSHDATAPAALKKEQAQLRPPSPAVAPPVQSAEAPERAAPAAAWEAVRQTNDLLALHEFIEGYPAALGAAEARARLDRLIGESEDIEALQAIAGRADGAPKALAEKRIETVLKSKAPPAEEEPAQEASEYQASPELAGVHPAQADPPQRAVGVIQAPAEPGNQQ